MFNLQAGKNISANDIHEYSQNFPYACYGGNGIRGYVSDYNRDGKFPIIGRQGALCGNVNFAEGKFYATEHAVVVTCFAGVNVEWTRYVLEAMNLNQYATATAQPGLSVATVNEVEFMLPPLNEQCRIAEFIANCFEEIESLTTQTNDLRLNLDRAKSKILDLAIHGKLVPQDSNDESASELLKRINPKAIASCDTPHYEQVGLEIPSNWLISSLSEICDNINGLWTGKKPPFVKVGVIRNANFTKDFRLDYSKIEYIEVEEKSFEKRHLLNGDIIVEKSGGSDKNPVGRAILYEGADKQFSYSNFTMALRIRNHSCVYSKYLYYYLMAIYIRGDMRKLQTQTTGLHNLILDSYLSMPIYLPPFEEQKRIVNKIDELFKSLEAIAITLR